MNLFIFFFAGAMVLTFIAITPRKLGHSAHYPHSYYEMRPRNYAMDRPTEQEPGGWTILMYTVIFVGGLLLAMAALA